LPLISPKTAAKIFWLFAFFHLLFWTIYPWLTQPSPGTYDVMEAFIMGKEWIMGSAKHPPLPFWVLESIYQICGRADFAGYLAAQCWVLLGLWAVWRLSREYLPILPALLVVGASSIYRYFNLGALSYTTSVPPVSLWCLAICFFYLSLQYNRFFWWFLTGLVLGLGLLSKYSVGILILSILLFMIWNPKGRSFWKTSGPWISTLTAFFVFLPHLIWVVQNDFITVRSAEGVLVSAPAWYQHIKSPLTFACSQIFLFLPVLIALIPLTGFSWQLERSPLPMEKEDRFKRSFLNFMILFPFLLHVLVALFFGTKMRTAYGSPLWTLIALWMLVFFRYHLTRKTVRRTIYLIVFLYILTIGSHFVNYQLGCIASNKAAKIYFPGRQLAEELTKRWQKVSDRPCPYLSGEWKLAGHAAYQMKDRPSVLCYYYGINISQKPAALYASDKDFNEKGGIILWGMDHSWKENEIPDWISKRYPCAQISPEILEIPWDLPSWVPQEKRKNFPPLRVRYAILSPPGESKQIK
ncbi:MAG: glycosyltransferase family 39 protein, partial [Planctomycetia bacterium]|nr:glycosyltransferase family 39 protein [Planctomycetia bacterium]